MYASGFGYIFEESQVPCLLYAGGVRLGCVDAVKEAVAGPGLVELPPNEFGRLPRLLDVVLNITLNSGI